MKISNIYLGKKRSQSQEKDEEVFENILEKDNIIIERIISSGQVTPEGKWYDQDKDEWVLLLKGDAKIELENSEIIILHEGDYIHIPAHLKHRVAYTSSTPPCIWLAIYFDSK